MATLKNMCKECGGKLVISDYGELVCSNCGIVYDKIYIQPLFEIEPLSDFSAIEKLYVSPDGKPIQKSGLGSTFIKVKGAFRDKRGKEVDKVRFTKLQKIDLLYTRGNLYKVHNATITLQKVCTILKIPRHIYERACYLSNKALSTNKHLGTTYQIAAASLLIALKELKYPITLRDVALTFYNIGHKVTAKSIMRVTNKISNELSLKKALRRPEDYIIRAINVMKSNDNLNRKILFFTNMKTDEYYTLLLKYSYEIYNKVNETYKIGKNPYLLAVSIVYVANKALCKKIGCQPIISQKDAAEILGSTEYTIRQHYKYLSEIIKDVIYEF